MRQIAIRDLECINTQSWTMRGDELRERSHHANYFEAATNPWFPRRAPPATFQMRAGRCHRRVVALTTMLTQRHPHRPHTTHLAAQIRHRGLKTVALSYFGGIGLDLMLTCLAPNDQPDGAGSVPERHRLGRAGIFKSGTFKATPVNSGALWA
jgi:hypothetical protein